MPDVGRYSTAGLAEAEFEPGSRGRVLRNLLGIRRKREMEGVETRELLRAMEELVGEYGRDRRFTAADVRRMHQVWLRPIYGWAGKYRSVNMGKGGFVFAAAHLIPSLMEEFERGPLRRFTPCVFAPEGEIVEALAVVHTELLLVHPFREGNGRIARVLSTLMALQAGLPPLDFDGIRRNKRQEYFSAVRAGLDRDYRPMQRVFRSVLRRTFGGGGARGEATLPGNT